MSRAVVLSFVALCTLAGCGAEPIGLPQEPQSSGGFTGEIAYEWQYRWNEMPYIADMALVSGFLFVIDEESGSVRAYRSNTDAPEEIPESGVAAALVDTLGVAPFSVDTLSTPFLITEGRGNTFWVAFAEGRRRLQEFDLNTSEPTDSWIAGDSIETLSGIAVDPDSGFVYVADDSLNRISKYEPSPEGGRRVAVLSRRGRGDTFVLEPRGLFYFSDSLLVADTGNNRIQVIHADVPETGRGEVRDPLGVPLAWRTPVDVWVDDAGLFYVAESGRVTQISSQGELKETVTENDPESAPEPRTLAANETQVWVPDDSRRRLTVYQINTVLEIP